ncbi:hypothetical protein DIPPA_65459 [Diplonema papillatum]|nr:hypothetical protein DIPPA_65459 [Diplonema papillatum]
MNSESTWTSRGSDEANEIRRSGWREIIRCEVGVDGSSLCLLAHARGWLLALDLSIAEGPRTDASPGGVLGFEEESEHGQPPWVATATGGCCLDQEIVESTAPGKKCSSALSVAAIKVITDRAEPLVLFKRTSCVHGMRSTPTKLWVLLWCPGA